jgi:hypothetical protein
VQSTLRFARAIDTPNSHSAGKFGDAPAAPHSASSHNTSTLAYDFAAAYAVSASVNGLISDRLL